MIHITLETATTFVNMYDRLHEKDQVNEALFDNCVWDDRCNEVYDRCERAVSLAKIMSGVYNDWVSGVSITEDEAQVIGFVIRYYRETIK